MLLPLLGDALHGEGATHADDHVQTIEKAHQQVAADEAQEKDDGHPCRPVYIKHQPPAAKPQNGKNENPEEYPAQGFHQSR